MGKNQDTKIGIACGGALEAGRQVVAVSGPQDAFKRPAAVVSFSVTAQGFASPIGGDARTRHE